MPRRGIPTVVRGVRYRSRFEATVARDLHTRGHKFAYERDKLYYDVPRVTIMDLTFERHSDDEDSLYVEMKGYMPVEDRRKLIEIQKANMDLDIRILFQDASKRIGKGPKSMTYGQWATRNGFEWAEGTIPASWLGEFK